MPENRQELLFPFGGLNDSEAASDQPDGTTVEAVNMRPFDPTNGRRRGAQRSGLKKWATVSAAEQINGTNRLQALIPVKYDQRRITYEMLTTPTKEWEAITPSFGTGYATEIDEDGNIYIFEGTNSVLKYNADGTKLASITLPANEGETVVPRLAIDEFKSIFVALNGAIGGRVIKYSLDEERGYLQDWITILSGHIRDFSVKNDLLMACVDREPDAEGTTASMLAYIGTSFSTSPTFAWEKAIPGPVSGLSLTSSAVFFASQANSSRGLLDETYNYNTVKWTPTEIDEATERMHFWLDASNFADAGYDFDNDDRITGSIDNIISRTDYHTFEAFDTTQRRMRVPDETRMETSSNTNEWTRKAPKFQTQIFGTYPAIDFLGRTDTVGHVSGSDNFGTRMEGRESGGNVLISDANATNGGNPYTDSKNGEEGALNDNHCAIPGQKDQRYIFAIVGRIKDWSNPPSVIFTAQDSGTISDDQKNVISLLANLADNGTDRDEGKITFHMKNATYGVSGGTTDSVPFDLKAIAPTGDFILTYVVDSGTAKSAVRINGRALDSMTVLQATDAIQMQGLTGSVTSPSKRQNTGRFILGGPCQGFTLGQDDRMGADNRVLAGDELGWEQGAPMYCSYKVPPTDLSSTLGYVGFGPVGNPTANSTVHDQNQDGTVDTPVGNLEFFNGYIGEVLTVLADHTGGGVNNAAISQPLNASSKAPARGEHSNSEDSESATEVEKIEGYLAWKWGMAFVLPADSGSASAGLYIGHPFKAAPPASGESVDVIGYDDSDYNQGISSKQGITAKLALTGEGKWAAAGAGMGYGVVANEDGDVLTVGPLDADATNPGTGELEPWVQARKLVDQGSTFSALATDGGWSFSEPTEVSAYTLNYAYPRLSLDTDGNLYWPLSAITKASHVRKLTASDGALEWVYLLDNSQQAYGIAKPPSRPEYDDETITSPEFLYISSDNGGTNTLPQLTKIRLVTATQNIDEGYTTRSTKLLAIAGGNMVVAGKTSNTTPTDGASALASDGLYVSGVSAFQKAYVTDGLTYKVYDPKTDIVTGWKAEKSGEIPQRCTLIGLWRGRMVLGRDPDDPHNWHMSAMGDPDDWDQSPTTPVATQAISGNNARAGKLADIVNSIIPYNDDLLLFGCDSKIYRLTGDPMAGGQLDLVSESTGIAFGKSWCKDPEGVIYFFGSRGGVFAMTPTGEIQNISGNKIERRLQEIELDRHRVELIWNDREQGLHVVQIPYSYKEMDLTSWFWDRRHDAWFEDELTTSNKQFTAMSVMDGDKFDDRVLVFGCEDGRLRKWDERKDDDDGDPIFSRILIGPITDEASDRNFRFGKVQVELAGEQGGANYDFFSSIAADKQGAPIQSGALQAGSNGVLSGKQRGGSAWIRLRSGADDQRWALESISMAMYSAGRKRLH